MSVDTFFTKETATDKEVIAIKNRLARCDRVEFHGTLGVMDKFTLIYSDKEGAEGAEDIYTHAYNPVGYAIHQAWLKQFDEDAI